MDFIKSITIDVSGTPTISPDVFAITVGNEVDQTFQDQAPNGTANGAPIYVNAASRLARTEWWMVRPRAAVVVAPGRE